MIWYEYMIILCVILARIWVAEPVHYISCAVLPSPAHLCDNVRNSGASLEPKQQHYELSVAGKRTIRTNMFIVCLLVYHGVGCRDNMLFCVLLIKNKPLDLIYENVLSINEYSGIFLLLLVLPHSRSGRVGVAHVTDEDFNINTKLTH